MAGLRCGLPTAAQAREDLEGLSNSPQALKDLVGWRSGTGVVFFNTYSTWSS